MGKQHSPQFLKIVDAARQQVRECSVHDLQAAIAQGATVIDVREESEFAAGHVPGAVHLSKGIIERDIEKRFPDPSQTLYLYCGGGFRSALAGENLQKMGYTGIISVDGGYSGWTQAGYPVTR